MRRLRRFALPAAVFSCALAVPSANALQNPLALLRGWSHSLLLHNTQGYLGVDLKDVTPQRAAELKLKQPQGAEVVTVDHDAPAAKAGFKMHDVILQMNGQQIQDCVQLRHLLRKQPPGRVVAFTVGRDGTTLEISVQLADRALLEQQAWSQHFSVAPPDDEATNADSFAEPVSAYGSSFMGSSSPDPLYVGAEVNPLRTQLAEYFGVTGGTGLLVENVDSESPASQAGLQAGDVILKVNASAMTSRNDWIKAIREHRGETVQVTIMRNRQQLTLSMMAGNAKKHG